MEGRDTPVHYAHLARRLRDLERWYALGDRPSSQPSSPPVSVSLSLPPPPLLPPDDSDLLASPVDDLGALRTRCDHVQEAMWAARPAPAVDATLRVGASIIAGAGYGLFTTEAIGAGVACCFYSGNVHSLKSSMRLDDRAYLMRIGRPVASPWWCHAGRGEGEEEKRGGIVDDSITNPTCSSVDAEAAAPDCGGERARTGAVPSSSSPSSSSPLSSTPLAAPLDKIAAGCVYVDPVDLRIKARYINDCVNPSGHNVRFVPIPAEERAHVVTLRAIEAGEELFVDYGSWYWEGSDIVGAVLSDAELDRLARVRRGEEHAGGEREGGEEAQAGRYGAKEKEAGERRCVVPEGMGQGEAAKETEAEAETEAETKTQTQTKTRMKKNKRAKELTKTQAAPSTLALAPLFHDASDTDTSSDGDTSLR